MSGSSTANYIRQQIETGGEKVWRFQDFQELPFPAVTQALSRLARKGFIERIGKGLYYRPRKTAFGPSRPHPNLIQELPLQGKAMFPAGTAATSAGIHDPDSGQERICDDRGQPAANDHRQGCSVAHAPSRSLEEAVGDRSRPA